MLGAPSKHAIRAIMYLMTREGDEYISVKQLAKDSDLPMAYLSKLIKTLGEHEIVNTKKGANGGVKLNKTDLSFYDICSVFDDTVLAGRCFLLSETCDAENPCIFHDLWTAEKERLVDFLKNTKIEPDK